MNNDATTDLQKFLNEVASRVTASAQILFDSQPKTAGSLEAAMRYSVFNGGKRLRPALIYATCQALGGTWVAADAPALALELVHCYSLVHDDLPCMDDDDLRRGMPTCHRQFDSEALALLAGDSLQSLAFLQLTQAPHLTDAHCLLMLKYLSQAALDMARGQSLDLLAENAPVTLAALENIHRLKTGALMAASMVLGALAAGILNPDTLEALHELGNLLGLCFQVQDDILNVSGSTERLGKRTGSDQHLGKSTYPQLLGLKAAQELRQQLHTDAFALLQKLQLDTPLLHQLTRFLVFRDW